MLVTRIVSIRYGRKLHDFIEMSKGSINHCFPFKMQWLEQNNYQQDPNVEPIAQEYLDEGYLFVAMKLATKLHLL